MPYPLIELNFRRGTPSALLEIGLQQFFRSERDGSLLTPHLGEQSSIGFPLPSQSESVALISAYRHVGGQREWVLQGEFGIPV